MARSRWKVNYKPIYHLMMAVNTNIEKAAEEAAKVGGEIVHENFAKFFEEGGSGRWEGHHQTGLARQALVSDFKNYKGNVMYKVGFTWKKPHGLVVIFFERGSPTLTPSPIKIITHAKNDKRIIPAMEEVFKKYIDKSK